MISASPRRRAASKLLTIRLRANSEGVTVYITEQGARRLAEELSRLTTEQRPRVVAEVATAAAMGDRSENAEYIYGKKRLREIDRRIGYITRRLDEASVVRVSDLPQDSTRIFFGATVEVEDEVGHVRRYRLVGPDETQPESGDISYQSPLGRALMGQRVGQTAVVHRPAGDLELTVVAIGYGR